MKVNINHNQYKILPEKYKQYFKKVKNNHPTLKPISLNYKILSLFKSPNNDKICFPFAGAGSEIIGGIKAGFTEYDACEINPEYIQIANARIEYWQDKNLEDRPEKVYENPKQLKLF